MWSRQCGPALGCSRAPESGTSRRVCVRSIGVRSVRTDGETESVLQQECSTGHGPRLSERAPVMLHAAMKWGTAVRSELIAHLDCRVRRTAWVAHAEEECGIHVLGASIHLVTTRDVVSFAFVTSDSSQSSPRECLFLVDTV